MTPALLPAANAAPTAAPPIALALTHPQAPGDSPRPGGRPTLYTPQLVRHLAALIREHGHSATRAAALLGICGETLRRWRRKHPEFSPILQRATRQHWVGRRLLLSPITPQNLPQNSGLSIRPTE